MHLSSKQQHICDLITGLKACMYSKVIHSASLSTEPNPSSESDL